jgi:hypothetical protein
MGVSSGFLLVAAGLSDAKSKGQRFAQAPDSQMQIFRPSLRGATGPAFGGPDDKLRDEAIHVSFAARWIASRSLSSGANSRGRLARNDGALFLNEKFCGEIKIGLDDGIT